MLIVHTTVSIQWPQGIKLTVMDGVSMVPDVSADWDMRRLPQQQLQDVYVRVIYDYYHG